MKEITRAKGGTLERVIPVNEIQVPDLWHPAMRLHSAGEEKDSQMILECWYLCLDLLRAIKEDTS